MRPSRDAWAMELATATKGRTTCLRRGVGAVLLNTRGHVLSTGYNGVASGQAHCNHYDMDCQTGFPHACKGSTSGSGTDLDNCQAIHAEQNALMQCPDVYDIDTCYVTTSPCMTCTKLLLNTSCKRIVFIEEYPHSDAKVLWEAAGRTWERFGGFLTFLAPQIAPIFFKHNL